MSKKNKVTGSDNSFINLRDGAAGQVLLRLHANKLNAEGQGIGYYGKVARFTYSNQNVLDLMAEQLPDMKVGRITDVMTAYTKVLLGVLASGHAVRLGSLGCFYIAPVGIAANPGERLPLTVRFSPDGTLLDAVSKVEVSASTVAAPGVDFGTITDVSRVAADGTLIAGGSVLIEGSGLCIGGKESGLWLAPATDDGRPSGTEAEWQKVSSFLYNFPRKLVFTLPADLAAGKYVFVLRTRFGGSSKYERKEMLEGVSGAFTVRQP